jgi:hypothetical protein
METKFNFNSQVCTSRSQSEKLLALGLKPETADMWYPHFAKTCPLPLVDETLASDDIPAWSLGRLWELYWSNKVVSDCLFGCGENMNPYAMMIAMIEYDIEDGTFNKDYLDK